MAFFAGKDASIGDGTDLLTASEWSLQLQDDIVDVTNFTSTGGKQENISGVQKASVSASGPYNGTINNAVVLGAVTTFSLDIGGAGPTFSCPARVSQIEIRTSVRGAGEFSVQAESTGDWTISP